MAVRLLLPAGLSCAVHPSAGRGGGFRPQRARGRRRRSPLSVVKLDVRALDHGFPASDFIHQDFPELVRGQSRGRGGAFRGEPLAQLGIGLRENRYCGSLFPPQAMCVLRRVLAMLTSRAFFPDPHLKSDPPVVGSTEKSFPNAINYSYYYQNKILSSYCRGYGN